MTNQELLALKELAQKAKPFTNVEPKTWEELTEEEKEITGYNGEFFETAHSVIPALIDELLAFRASKYGERIENVAEWKRQNVNVDTLDLTRSDE